MYPPAGFTFPMPADRMPRLARRLGLHLGCRLALGLACIAWLGTLPAEARPPAPTRLVAVFRVKEQQLNEAMAAGDLESIDRLVSRDFEVRPGEAPGRPIPRANWLQGSPASEFPGLLEQFSARPVGAAVLVSFLWVLPGERGRVAVVDLWDGEDENAHLLLRHATPIGRTVLQQGSSDGTLPKRE